MPNATLTTDTTNPQKLTALAVTADHETIAGILEEIDVASPAETASSVEVYTIEGMTAAAASIILRTQVPLARVSLGSDPQQLVVYARPADHQQIKQVVEGIATASAEGETARVAQVYTLDSLTATAAMAFLRRSSPRSSFPPAPRATSSSPGHDRPTMRKSRPRSTRSTWKGRTTPPWPFTRWRGWMPQKCVLRHPVPPNDGARGSPRPRDGRQPGGRLGATEGT